MKAAQNINRPWKFCGIVAAALASVCLVGGSAVRAEDQGAKAFECRFEQGHTWSYEGGQFKSAAPAALTFEVTDIDLDAQKANLLIDGKHAAKLTAIRALNANSYLETANEGFLNLTTIYDKDPATGLYPAVHSRHFGILGQPMFAQYTGTCTAK